MKIKLPHYKPLKIGQNVNLNLSFIDYNGYSLTSLLIRKIIRTYYKTYKHKKYNFKRKRKTPANIKKLILDSIHIMKQGKGVVTGVIGVGNLYFNHPCNQCYLNGSYKGLDTYVYDVAIYGENLEGKHVQFKMSNLHKDHFK